MVRFWSWFYGSEIVVRIAQATGYGVFPWPFRKALMVQLEADILCQGSPVFADAPEVTFTLESAGVPWLSAAMELSRGIYSNVRGPPHN